MMEIKDSCSKHAEHVETDIVENYLERYSSEFKVFSSSLILNYENCDFRILWKVQPDFDSCLGNRDECCVCGGWYDRLHSSNITV